MLEIYCPFVVGQNTHVHEDELENDLLCWARKYHLVTNPAEERRFHDARYGSFTLKVYPDAQEPLIYAKWIAWLFAFDDYFDENRHSVTDGRIEGITDELLSFLPLNGARPASATTALTAALTDLWSELSGEMTAPLRERFRRHADQHARTYASDLARTRNQPAPDLKRYINLRRCSGAVDTCLDLIERRPQACLTPAIADSAEVLALRLAANDIICWTNDVMSYIRELQHGECTNRVAVVQEAAGTGLQASFDICTEMIAVRTREYESLYASLPTNGNNNLETFADATRLWIAGSLAWHRESPRYTTMQTKIDDYPNKERLLDLL